MEEVGGDIRKSCEVDIYVLQAPIRHVSVVWILETIDRGNVTTCNVLGGGF